MTRIVKNFENNKKKTLVRSIMRLSLIVQHRDDIPEADWIIYENSCVKKPSTCKATFFERYRRNKIVLLDIFLSTFIVYYYIIAEGFIISLGSTLVNSTLQLDPVGHTFSWWVAQIVL